MRYPKTHCIFILFLVGLFISCGNCLSMAAEDQIPRHGSEYAGNHESPEQEVYYETEGDYYWGYRWASSEDSLKASEYIYSHSSITFGMNLLSCPLPYRYHLNGEFINKYDFYTDAGFAYKDVVLFRDILVGGHHNLAHFAYQDAGEPPGVLISDRNPLDPYFIDFINNRVALRLKNPNFPFHTFFNHRHIEQDGRIQQRSLLGYFTPADKVSESRDIDWTSNSYTLGTNSHAGPVEIEYAFDHAGFDPGPNNILYDTFLAASSRPADVYPHALVAETESSAHSIKFHSSYTGGIVAAGTISNLNQTNNFSGTESTTWKGALDFTWIPDPKASFFFKYRHKSVDMDNPDSVTLTGQSNTMNYSVRQSMSSFKDVFTLSARYRPDSLLSLFGTYEFSHLEREDVAQWFVIPGQSNVHRINLSAHARPLDKLDMKAVYEYHYYDQPAYNSTPDTSNELRLTSTYTPTDSLTLYLEYILAVSERDSLQYLNSSPSVLVETGGRDGRHDQILASASKIISPKASMTVSWFFQRWDVEQDLAYGKWLMAGLGDLPYIDFAVPYTDESHSFSVSFCGTPRKDVTLVADITHTITKGTTGYDDVVGSAPFSLSSFSDTKASETNYSIDITKKMVKDWEVGVRSFLSIYNDRSSGVQDGNVFTTIFRVKRFF